MLCEGCYFIPIGRAKRFKYTTCGRVYFLKRRKTSPPDPDTCGRGLNLSVSRRTVPYAKIPRGFSIAKEVRAHVRTDVQKATPLGRQDSMQSIGIAEAFILLLNLH